MQGALGWVEQAVRLREALVIQQHWVLHVSVESLRCAPEADDTVCSLEFK